MDAVHHLSDLLEYTEWANRRVLAVVEDLSGNDLAYRSEPESWVS